MLQYNPQQVLSYLFCTSKAGEIHIVCHIAFSLVEKNTQLKYKMQRYLFYLHIHEPLSTISRTKFQTDQYRKGYTLLFQAEMKVFF
jgi:hypothetical protein